MSVTMRPHNVDVWPTYSKTDSMVSSLPLSSDAKRTKL